MTNEEILDAVRWQLETDSRFKDELVTAISAKSESWVMQLIRRVIPVIVEIGRGIISAITGWFLPRPSGWPGL